MKSATTLTANKAVLFILLIAILLWVGYTIRHTVSSFLFSFVLAYLLDPIVVYLERHKIRRTYGIALLYVVLAIFSLFCLTIFIPFLTLRWESLLRDLPNYLQKLKAIFLSWEVRSQPLFAADELRWLMDTAIGRLDNILGKISTGMYNLAGRMAFNLFNLVLAPILVLFMLYYKNNIVSGTISCIPPRWREIFMVLGREIHESIGGYIRGQLIVSLIVAVLSTLALITLDIDYPVLNGIFAGLASILPFIGVILATLPPLLFAFLILIKILLAFSLIYFLEGYLVKPLVFKKSMNINPLATIIAVMAFGELIGFWGILLAIPLMSAAKIVTSHLLRGDFVQGE
jgi:putative permease